MSASSVTSEDKEITQEPNAFRDGKKRFEQGVAELFEFASLPDGQSARCGFA
jgi:hypothetical protein